MKPANTSKPHLIIMAGIPGSGKSFFAEHFAKTFKSPIVSYNHLQKELFINPTGSAEEYEIIERMINLMLDEVLKTERTVVFDGPLLSRKNSELIDKKAIQFGYRPLYVWAQVDLATAKKRTVKNVVDKPIITSAQFDEKIKKFYAPNRIKDLIVISGKHTYASQLKIVLKYLATPS